MQRKFPKLISIALFLSAILFIPGESNEANFENNYSKNKTSKIKRMACSDDENIIQDFDKSFDHENRRLIERVDERNNFIDFFGIGPSRYPENRIVQESKKMWDTFECHLSRFTEKYKHKTTDIFNGYNSSLSEFE